MNWEDLTKGGFLVVLVLVIILLLARGCSCTSTDSTQPQPQPQSPQQPHPQTPPPISSPVFLPPQPTPPPFVSPPNTHMMGIETCEKKGGGVVRSTKKGEDGKTIETTTEVSVGPEAQKIFREAREEIKEERKKCTTTIKTKKDIELEKLEQEIRETEETLARLNSELVSLGQQSLELTSKLERVPLEEKNAIIQQRDSLNPPIAKLRERIRAEGEKLRELKVRRIEML